MDEIFKALENAADGAFQVDDRLRIHSWNKAAEKMLGFNSNDVVGKYCYEILQGIDDKRQLICTAYCNVLKLALKSKPVSNYDLKVRTIEGDNRWLNMSILCLKLGQNGEKQMIIHLFRDISQKKNDEMFFRKFMETARRYHKIPLEPDEDKNARNLIENLTKRQQEVLTLLARGLSTQDIAENLSISMATVRNHIQHIFQELQVHSRLEAVTYALRNGLAEQPSIIDEIHD